MPLLLIRGKVNDIFSKTKIFIIKNGRNYKNPTVIAWEQLRQLLTQFADRMQNFDAMAQKQGRDIGVDEVFNEIQNIIKQLDEIQKGLNLQNNTINTERVVDKSQPETPFSITNNNRNDESKNLNKKLIRLTESDLHRIVKESVNKIINESMYQDSYDWTLSTLDRRLKKHSIEDVISFAKKELQFMDNMEHRMNGQDKGQYDAYRDFILKYQH